MSIHHLMPAFLMAVDLWKAHDALGDDAPDTRPGDVLDAATELQCDIVAIAAHVPATTSADIAAKLFIADHIDRALNGFLGEDGMPLTSGLRQSIAFDRRRLAS